MNTIGNYAPDFEIPGIDQEVYHLGSYRRKFKVIAVVFMGNVPEVNQYIERLKQIQAEFAEQKFTVMGIDANYRSEPISDSMEAMREYAKIHELNFPYLRDTTQDVAKAFKASVVPTAYLLDSNAVIRYQGVIDDNGASSVQVQNSYLRDSIAKVLSGGEVTRDYIEPVGSKIQWRPQ